MTNVLLRKAGLAFNKNKVNTVCGDIVLRTSVWHGSAMPSRCHRSRSRCRRLLSSSFTPNPCYRAAFYRRGLNLNPRCIFKHIMQNGKVPCTAGRASTCTHLQGYTRHDAIARNPMLGAVESVLSLLFNGCAQVDISLWWKFTGSPRGRYPFSIQSSSSI